MYSKQVSRRVQLGRIAQRILCQPEPTRIAPYTTIPTSTFLAVTSVGKKLDRRSITRGTSHPLAELDKRYRHRVGTLAKWHRSSYRACCTTTKTRRDALPPAVPIPLAPLLRGPTRIRCQPTPRAFCLKENSGPRQPMFTNIRSSPNSIRLLSKLTPGSPPLKGRALLPARVSDINCRPTQTTE